MLQSCSNPKKHVGKKKLKGKHIGLRWLPEVIVALVIMIMRNRRLKIYALLGTNVQKRSSEIKRERFKRAYDIDLKMLRMEFERTPAK